jgi:hypothetical protein
MGAPDSAIATAGCAGVWGAVFSAVAVPAATAKPATNTVHSFIIIVFSVWGNLDAFFIINS